MNNFKIKKIKDVINTIRLRQEMYLGNNHPSSLRSSLDGYIFASSTHHIETEDSIPFWYFHYKWNTRLSITDKKTG